MLGYDTEKCPMCNDNQVVTAGKQLVCPQCGSLDPIVVLSKLLNLPIPIARQVHTQNLYGAPDARCFLTANNRGCLINAMDKDGVTSKEYPSIFPNVPAEGAIYIVDDYNLVRSSPYPNTLTWSSKWLPYWSNLFNDRKASVMWTTKEAECRAIAMSLTQADNQIFLGPFTDWDSLDRLQPYRLSKPIVTMASEEPADLKDVIAKFHYKMSGGKMVYKSEINAPIYLVMEAVIEWLKNHGAKFLWDIDSSCGHMIFEGKDYPLNYNNPILRSFLKTKGGILGATSEGKAIIDGLCSMAEEAEHVTPIPWLSCDSKKREVSIRQGSTVITVKENSVTESKCETLSYDLIQGDKKWFSPVKLIHVTPEQKKEGLQLLFTAVANFFAVPDVAREVIICWMIAIFLKDFASIRPGMVITGPASTGKSTMLQLLYWLFYGKDEAELPTFPTVAGLWRVGSVEPFLPIDNKNMDGMEDAVRTFLDVASTGGKRIMGVAGGSNNHESKTQKVHSLVMISGLDVPLHHDVRTRYIEIMTDFAHKGEFFPLRDKEALFDNRDLILSSVLYTLADDVLPAINSFANSESCRLYRVMLDTKERMSDYFLLMVAIGSALQKHGIIPEGDIAMRWTDYIRTRANQTEHTNAKTIEWWKNFKIALLRDGIQFAEDNSWDVIKIERKRVGIQGTPEELLNALAWAANILKRKLPWESSKSLINSFKMEGKAWENAGWPLEITEDYGYIKLFWGDGV